MAAPLPLWTIDELGASVALALSADYEGPADNRARDLPDLRTIRYYTTLGMIDPPADMRGRTALYGKRHLAQVVAIKRLQVQGLSLAEIQRQLLVTPDAALFRLARLPDIDRLFTPVKPSASANKTDFGRKRDSFWKASPAAVDTEPTPEARETMARHMTLQGVPLEQGVTLLLQSDRALTEEDLQAIRSVAAPLTKLLRKRRLIRPRNERDIP